MKPIERSRFLAAIAEIPKKHRAWLASNDIELYAYHGWGVVLNDAQLEAARALVTLPPDMIHVWRWANRTGKTTGLELLESWAAWTKWRYQSADLELWLRYKYRVLHAAPLNRLAAKAYEGVEQLLALAHDAQVSPVTSRPREALLLPFFQATKETVNDVDTPILACANGAVVDYLSTQGGAGRLESEAWWMLVWDEFPRQQPWDDIPLLIDQTFLPRAVDHNAPLIFSGTATADSEPAYMDLEDRAKDKPHRWHFSTFARSANFAISQTATQRQIDVAIDSNTVDRSVGGGFGEGTGELFPEFVLDNAFVLEDDEELPPTEGSERWRDELGKIAYWTGFDHGIGSDPNIVQTWKMPWPPREASVLNPIRAVHRDILKARRSLTPNEMLAFMAAEYELYNPQAMIVDAAAEGGLMVFRQARADGYRVIDCSFTARFIRYVSNKEFGLMALQRLLGWGLLEDAGGKVELVSDWRSYDPRGKPFGLLKFPKRWASLKLQLRRLARDDEKMTQDEAMTAVMLAWHLFKLVEQGRGVTRPQRFDIVSRAR